MALPIKPVERYEVSILVERLPLAGAQAFDLGFVVNESRSFVVTDSWNNGTLGTSGIHLLDQRQAPENETARRLPNVLPVGKRTKLIYTITPSGVRCTCDGEKLIDWEGDPKRLSRSPLERNLPNFHGLFVGGYNCHFRIHEITFTNLGPAVIEK